MKKIFYNIAILAMALIATTSCESYLDKEYDASKSDEKVFGDEVMTRGFQAGLYNYLPDGIGVFGDDQWTASSRDCMTDNAISFWGLHYYNNIVSDGYTSNTHVLANNFWTNDVKGIRACNIFLEKADEVVIGNKEMAGNDDSKLYDRYIAEAKFIRALLHFDLICWFGDVPIIEHSFQLTDNVNMERTKAGDALQWVADQCDQVKDVLPLRYKDETTNWGRINGCAAYMLKSRALLYKASKLNLNKTKEPITAEKAWKDAAEAAKQAVEKCEAANYKLNGNKGSYNTSSEGDYYKVFASDPTQSNEIILSRSVWMTTQVERLLMPIGFSGGGFTPVGRTSVTQNLVDAYETINGLPIDKDAAYNDQKPYDNRDPRLNQTIFHQGSEFGGSGTSLPRSVDVREDVGEDLGTIGAAGGTATGYYCKKWCYNIDRNNAANQPHFWIIFRFAEALMNAAEACYMANEKSAALGYINQVRERAGMPPYDMSSLTEERIQNERRVEFCFEDQRYFDQRRWMLFEGKTEANEIALPRYQQVYNMYGTVVTGDASAPQYDVQLAKIGSKRVFISPKHYLFPIPFTEYKKAPNLGQNEGW